MSWPHAPQHWLFEPGIYMITAGTYGKHSHLAAEERRAEFQHLLFAAADEFGWQLQAWAILPNHYHLIAVSPDQPQSLRKLIGKLHMQSAKAFNSQDATPGRKVWFQYWDSRITFEHSYLARLNYVHSNPVKHGLATTAKDYPWCSAAWFAQQAPSAFVKTVAGFKKDQLKLPDDF